MQLKSVNEGQEAKLLSQQGGWEWSTTGRRLLPGGLLIGGWNRGSGDGFELLKNITGNRNLA